MSDEEIEDLGFDPEGMMRMDGYSDCVVGIVERFGQPPIICYDREKVLLKMEEQDEMSREEAVEFFEFNQLGAWVGDGTPCFITKSEKR